MLIKYEYIFYHPSRTFSPYSTLAPESMYWKWWNSNSGFVTLVVLYEVNKIKESLSDSRNNGTVPRIHLVVLMVHLKGMYLEKPKQKAVSILYT